MVEMDSSNTGKDERVQQLLRFGLTEARHLRVARTKVQARPEAAVEDERMPIALGGAVANAVDGI